MADTQLQELSEQSQQEVFTILMGHPVGGSLRCSFRKPISLSVIIPDSVDAVCGEGGVPGELGEGLRQPLTVRSLRLGLHQESHQLAVRVLKIRSWAPAWVSPCTSKYRLSK